MGWKDTTSRRWGDKTSPATSYEMDVPPLRVTVHQLHGVEGHAFVSCHAIGLDRYDLGEMTLEDAQEPALYVVCRRVRAMWAVAKAWSKKNDPEQRGDARATSPPRWRPEVVAFADAMERELCANDHKGGWKDRDKGWLMDRLTQEAKELREAIDLGGGRASKFFPNDPNAPTWQATVLSEAADVANFAMMIADVCDALDVRATPPASHRCPGCNAEHRGEYDHCETCRARIATPSGKETKL